MIVTDRPYIPDSEFKQRIQNMQAIMKREGVDIFLAYGNEAEPAYSRYFCDYWPSFESCGVVLAQEGDPILLIGPESYKYAVGRAVLPKIAMMLNYREAAEPDYPGIPLATYADVVKMSGCKSLKKLGLCGTAVMTKPTLDAIAAQLPGVEVVVAEDCFRPLRWVKSENELNSHRKAFKIAEKAVKAMLNEMNRKITSVLMRAQIPVREPEQVRKAETERRQDYSRYSANKQDMTDIQRAGQRDTRERQVTQPVHAEKTVGRNEPCPCGSGKKYKNCCGKNA